MKERRPAARRQDASADAKPDGGNDGSDFNYRMSVDNRYKIAAENRKLLTQIIGAQGFYAMSSALMSGALLGRPKDKPAPHEDVWWLAYSTASTHVKQLSLQEALPLIGVLVTAFASLFGSYAVKKNKPRAFQAVALLSLAAACMTFWPIFSGLNFSDAMAEYGPAVASGDFTWFGVITIRAIHEVIGFGFNIAVAFTAMRLAGSLVDTDKKKDK